MKLSKMTSPEKLTATVSASLAAAILTSALVATPPQATTGDQLVRLESDLRFQIDLAYKQDHAQLRAKTAEVDAVVAAWNKSPQAEVDAARLAEWFEASIDRSLPGALAALPPTPEFSKFEIASPAPPETTKIVTSPTPPAKPAQAVTQSQASSPPAHLAPTKKPPAIVPTPNRVERASPPLVGTTQPAPTPKRPSKGDAQAATPAPRPQVTLAARPATVAAAPAVNSPVKPAAPSPTSPRVAPPTADREPVRLDPAPIRVNLAELNARIRGYHDGLDQVAAAIVVGRDELTPKEIAALVDDLEQLASQRDFVQLYYGSLTADERAAVAAPRAIAPVAELVEAELKRATAAGDDFLQPFAADENDPATKLAARLHTLTAAAGK